MSNQPIVTRVRGGELSTVDLGNGMIETRFFPDDPNRESVLVNRTGRSIERIAMKDREKFESERND